MSNKKELLDYLHSQLNSTDVTKESFVDWLINEVRSSPDSWHIFPNAVIVKGNPDRYMSPIIINLDRLTRYIEFNREKIYPQSFGQWQRLGELKGFLRGLQKQKQDKALKNSMKAFMEK